MEKNVLRQTSQWFSNFRYNPPGDPINTASGPSSEILIQYLWLVGSMNLEFSKVAVTLLFENPSLTTSKWDSILQDILVISMPMNT